MDINLVGNAMSGKTDTNWNIVTVNASVTKVVSANINLESGLILIYARYPLDLVVFFLGKQLALRPLNPLLSFLSKSRHTGFKFTRMR